MDHPRAGVQGEGMSPRASARVKDLEARMVEIESILREHRRTLDFKFQILAVDAALAILREALHPGIVR